MRKRTILTAALALTVAGVASTGVVADRRRAEPTGSATSAPEALYQCAMHPQIVSDKPGLCPICQMRLERVDQGPSSATPTGESIAAAGERTVLFYRHPMRPDVTSPVPAKDEMGMDYVPVYEDEVSSRTSDVAGHAPFTLSAQRRQLIGVTKARVESRALTREIRAVGTVAYDPALYQAIAEYREAQKARAVIMHSPWREAHEGAEALIRSAALKLRQQGLSEEQILRLSRDGKAPVNLLLPDDSVWVYAQVYEYELELVRPGQPVTVTSPATPGKTYAARVAAIDPMLNPTTRSARVRVQIPTPDHDLRPVSFVQVKIQVPLGEALAVPESAILDTGEHQIAFVVSGEGDFEPRSLTLGREADGYHEVLTGLTAGEEVVTSANFLIDSESRFRAAVAAFAKTSATGHSH